MIRDGLLQFSATGGDSPTTGTQNSSNVLDLGIAGLPASTVGGGGGGARDLGIGDDPALKLSAIVTTAFTGGTSLGLVLQGAPDNGSGAPGTYTTMWTGPVLLEAALIAGAQLANVDLPRNIFEQALTRFLRVQYVTAGTHTAGILNAELVLDRIDQLIGTTGAMSGYPAGITVAN